MRSVAQSLLARHPVLTGVGVGCRWTFWLAAGHPFGLMIFGLAIVAGLPWWYRTTVWAGAEVALGLWGFVGLTTGAQSIYLWGHICRFRRRWPSQFARAYRSHRWPPVVVDNHYSVPGGLRPTFAAPRLSIMPLAFDHRTIGWRLLPLADHDIAETAAAVGRVGGSDDRVSVISLRSLPGGGLALIVRFRSPGTGRSSRLPTGLGSLVIDATGLSAIDPWDDPMIWPPSSGSGSGLDPAFADQIFRLGGLVGQSADGTEDDGRTTPGAAQAWSDRSGAMADERFGAGTLSAGRDAFISNVPPGYTGRRSGFPMKWSFSVVLPSNVLMAVVVGASDAGRVGVLAVCAATVVSLILIIAEGVASR